MKKSMLLKSRQQGVVLVFSMIMLLVLTLIGLSGTQATSLEEKMASNSRDQNLAFQAAESTLRVAERFILDETNNPILTSYRGVNGLGNPDPSPTPGLLNDTPGAWNVEPGSYFANNVWDPTSNPVLYRSTAAGFGANYGIPADPRYIIKKISTGPGTGAGPVTNFRITVRAVGNNPGTQIILQEVFVRTN